MLVISVSISSEKSIVDNGYSLIPKVIDFTAYQVAFKNSQQMISSYCITILSATIGTLFSIIIMSLAGYALSREEFAYKKFFSFFIFFTMLFSGGLVPSYIINSKYLGLFNNIAVHVVLGLVSAWNIIIFRTFFQQLPKALIESAIIDGASEARTFVSIVIPLSKPVFATIALLTVLARWNDWTTSLYYISKPGLFSLQYLLQNILRQAEFLKSMIQDMPSVVLTKDMQPPTESLRFAMCVIASGPMLLVFPFFQKYFAKGLTVGSVKG